MKRMLFLLLGGIYMLTGCSEGYIEYVSPEYIQEVDRLVYETLKPIQKQENIELIGYGGSMMNNIKLVSLRFQTKAEITEEIGIEWCCKIVEALVDKIGSSEKLKPYFYKGKFDASNIDLAFFSKITSARINVASFDYDKITFEHYYQELIRPDIVSKYNFEEEYKKYQERNKP